MIFSSWNTQVSPIRSGFRYLGPTKMSFRVDYCIPSDGDSPDSPNTFYASSADGKGLSLSDIRRAFPLPGSYHFRCKMLVAGNKAAWVDLTESGVSYVPVHDGESTVLKVVRKSWNSDSIDGRTSGMGNSHMNGPFDISSKQAGVAPQASNQYSSSSGGSAFNHFDLIG